MKRKSYIKAFISVHVLIFEFHFNTVYSKLQEIKTILSFSVCQTECRSPTNAFPPSCPPQPQIGTIQFSFARSRGGRRGKSVFSLDYLCGEYLVARIFFREKETFSGVFFGKSNNKR